MKKLLAVILSVLILFSGCELLADEMYEENRRLSQEVQQKEEYLTAVSDITKEFMSANIMIFVNKKSGDKAQGSGVIFKAEKSADKTTYYALTNWHVTDSRIIYLLESRSSIEVADYKGTVYGGGKVDFIAEDRAYDLAVISFESSTEYNVAEFSDSNPKIDTGVFAIGQPLGQRNALTFGYIKEYRKATPGGSEDIEFDCIYHTAFVDSGSSGGVLIDNNLKLVGINFAGGVYQSGGEIIGNVSVAVPVLKVKEFLMAYEIGGF